MRLPTSGQQSQTAARRASTTCRPAGIWPGPNGWHAAWFAPFPMNPARDLVRDLGHAARRAALVDPAAVLRQE